MVGLTWTLDARTASADGRGPRIGTLVSPGAPGEDVPVSIPTPALLTYTRRGEPAHLIPDVLDTLPPEARAFQTSLVHFMDHLSPSTVADHPAGGVLRLLPTFVLATARDPVTNDLNAKPSNAADATFVNTPVGVKRLTPADYMTWVRATRPHAFVALADESPGSHDGAPRKKIKRRRGEPPEWLDACARHADGVPVFACVQGGAEVDERRASAASAAARDDVFGFSIGAARRGRRARWVPSRAARCWRRRRNRRGRGRGTCPASSARRSRRSRASRRGVDLSTRVSAIGARWMDTRFV